MHDPGEGTRLPAEAMAVAIPHASLASQLPEDNETLEMAASSLTASPDSNDGAPLPGDFDIVQHYADLLQRDEVSSY